jgi:hypothetical protein
LELNYERKIKQFAELSKHYKTILVDGQMQSVLLIDPERFAGMIINECITVIENLSPGYKDYRDQIENAFRVDCIEEIKQYFEIKET